MSERISTWKLEEEGSSGRHLTGKRHSRRIQPRSLLSLLLSARRPFSPRPSRPPRKGCALFPSTRSASVSQEGPWRERYVGVEIKSLWRILTLRYRTLITRIVCRWLLVRQEPYADVWLRGRNYAIRKSDRLRYRAYYGKR